MYTYDAYVGVYPDTVWDEDHFDFEKLAGDGGVTQIIGWDCWGEPFITENFGGRSTPAQQEKFTLLGAFPNPFNPYTTISFTLPDEFTITVLRILR